MAEIKTDESLAAKHDYVSRHCDAREPTDTKVQRAGRRIV